MLPELEKICKEFAVNIKSILKGEFGIKKNILVPEVVKLPSFQSGTEIYCDLKPYIEEQLYYNIDQEITNLPKEISLDQNRLILQGILPKLKRGTKYLLFLQGYQSEEKTQIKKQYFLHFSVSPDPWEMWEVKEPKENLPYSKTHSDHQGLKEDIATCIAASLRGRSHAHDAWFREDDFTMDYDDENQVLILAVSDGAGSYRHSRKGSEIVCRKSVEITKRELRKEGDGENLFIAAQKYINNKITLEEMEKCVARVLGVKSALGAYSAIGQQAKTDGIPIKGREKTSEEDGYKYDGFAATMLLATIFCVEQKWCIATFWVGDGAMVAIDKDDIFRLGEPDHGKDVSSTNFLTHLTWNENNIANELVRRSKFYFFDSLEHIYIMTDGVSDPWLGDVFDNIENWKKLQEETYPLLKDESEESARLLCDWLSFKISQSHDDRTIIICSLNADFVKQVPHRKFERSLKKDTKENTQNSLKSAENQENSIEEETSREDSNEKMDPVEEKVSIQSKNDSKPIKATTSLSKDEDSQDNDT